jgi:hypothetical protein
METDAVWKNKEQFFPHQLAKRLLAFRTVTPGPAVVKPTNNKTGHFTCYKNRTFSFATDRQPWVGSGGNELFSDLSPKIGLRIVALCTPRRGTCDHGTQRARD